MRRSSVCILCYNQQDVIGATIESALTQAMPADEVLVADDGSTDGSVEIIRTYPDVRLIRHSTNRGRTAARNTLLAAAAGEILVYLDGDTTASPTLVGVLLGQYSSDRVGAVGGRGIEVCRKTRYDRWRQRHASQGWGPIRRDDVPWLYGLCCSFRRKALEHVGGFSGFSEDQDIGHALRREGYDLVYMPDAVVNHLRSDDARSLMHMIYRWWRGGFVVETRYGLPAWRHLLGNVPVELVRQIYNDLTSSPDPALIPVEFIVAVAKLQGIAAGWRHSRDSSR